ncbi:MAG: hypothetical protein QW292_08130 [Candidatus Parvarchaeota archaeon]
MFDNLQLPHIRQAVKISRNASTDYYNGSEYRGRIAREYKNMGYKRRSSLNHY